MPLGKSGLRGDLCERLGYGHLFRIPLLKERKRDIPALLEQFCRAVAPPGGSVTFTPSAIAYAQNNVDWKGQIRELRSAVEMLVVTGRANAELRNARVVEMRAIDALMDRVTKRLRRSPPTEVTSAAPAPAPSRHEGETSPAGGSAAEAEQGQGGHADEERAERKGREVSTDMEVQMHPAHAIGTLEGANGTGTGTACA